jgi:HEAT repeat protein
VRAELFQQIAAASFTMNDADAATTAILRQGIRDSSLAVRLIVLQTLGGRGDSVALDVLRSGLENPARAVIAPSAAVRILGLRDPRPYYPLLHRLMTQPPDSGTRLAAIRLLGGYAPSRTSLLSILRNRTEAATVREAAFGTLSANAASELPSAIAQVLRDDAEPTRLRIRAIKFYELKRTSRDPKVLRRAPDDIDTVIRQLAANSSVPEVRSAAATYVARTQSAR